MREWARTWGPLVFLVVVVNGLGVAMWLTELRPETELAHKQWSTETYKKVSNLYVPDEGNYALVEVEAIDGETEVIITVDGRPCTLKEGKIYRHLPPKVKYPGPGEHWLPIRAIVLKAGDKTLSRHDLPF